MKAIVTTMATATSAEVPINESTLVATAAKVRKILSIEPITATEVPIVTTRPEMPMDKSLLVATPAEVQINRS